MPDCKNGYVVSDDCGPLEIGHYEDTPKYGILLTGDYATVFKKRRSAVRAVKRTVGYGKLHNYSWSEEWKYSIRPLKPHKVV